VACDKVADKIIERIKQARPLPGKEDKKEGNVLELGNRGQKFEGATAVRLLRLN
jgi:hypothetical protein